MSTKILAAVSGGKDSMCMLDILLNQGYDVVVAHYNHNMRGEEADRDAQFVADYCRSRNLQCIVEKSVDVIQSEDKARNARYSFLDRCANQIGADKIATAHTKSDNAETVLLNIVRGTGIKGLCGIPVYRDNIIRPIINMTSEEVEQYNFDHNIPNINDSSNSTDDYSRNVIRHKVIPVLKEINPNVIDAIARLSSIASDDEEFFDKYLSNTATGEERAVVSRLIRKNCPKTLSFTNVESVLNLDDNEYKKLDLPGIKIIKDRGKIYYNPTPLEYKVTIEEGIVNNGLINNWIKYDSIVGDLLITTRLPGDKIRPAGRNCTKSLKKLFVEADLTQAQRDAWPIIRDNEGIVWIYNIAVAERAVAHVGDRAYKITVTEK